MSRRVVLHDYFGSLKDTTNGHSRICHKKKDGDESVKLEKKPPEFSQEGKNLWPSVHQYDSLNVIRKSLGR